MQPTIVFLLAEGLDRELVGRSLAGTHNCVFAVTPDDLLRILSQIDVDALVLDLGRTDADPFELLHACLVRNHAAACMTLASGPEQEDLARELRLLGARGSLTRPLAPAKLRAALARAEVPAPTLLPNAGISYPRSWPGPRRGGRSARGRASSSRSPSPRGGRT